MFVNVFPLPPNFARANASAVCWKFVAIFSAIVVIIRFTLCTTTYV